MTDLTTVRFGDVAYAVPADVARRVAALHASGDAHGAMAMARDNHAGGPQTVPDGGRVSVPFAMMDRLPANLQAGVREMTTHMNLNDANAELERLRAENRSLAGQNAALMATAPGRTVMDAASLTALADAAAQALRAEQVQRRQGAYGAAVDRLGTAWKAHHAA